MHLDNEISRPKSKYENMELNGLGARSKEAIPFQGNNAGAPSTSIVKDLRLNFLGVKVLL